MTLKLLSLALVLAAISCSNRFGLPDQDGVGLLDSGSFQEFVDLRAFTLVLFAEPIDIGKNSHIWTVFKNLAEKVEASNRSMPVIAVDVSESPDIPNELKVTTFPTIMLVSEKRQLVYRGQLDTNIIYDWSARNCQAKDERELTTFDDIKRVRAMTFAVILRFPKGDAQQESFFAITADNEPDTPIYFTHLNLREAGVQCESPYCLVLLRKFDDGDKMMAGENPFEDHYLRQFINMFKNPMIYSYSPEVADEVYSKNGTTLLIYFARNFTAQNNATFNNFAFQNRHKIKIYMCEFTDYGCLNLAYSMGHDDRESQAVFVLENKGEGVNRYKFKQGFTEGELTKFVNQFNEGLIGKFYKSEAEPKENAGAVKRVVRGTVNKLVLNNPNVVVLVGYSEPEQWAEMEAQFDQLALKFGAGGKVEFYRWDASRNEHENVFFTKVPGILLYGKQKKQPYVYLGKMEEAEDVEKFLASALKPYLGGEEGKEADKKGGENDEL